MLSNTEREKLVLDLYNQGKSIREIAKEARMSFRDINTVLKKAAAKTESENNKKQSDESSNGKAIEIVDKSTQAYKLFSEGKKPIEVAVNLGINGEETIRLYQEFWKLEHLNGLYKLYPEIKHILPSFLKLHKSLKRQGMGPKNVESFVEILRSADYDIPAIQIQLEYRKSEVEAMEHKENKLISEVNDLNNQLSYLQSLKQSYSESCSSLRQNIEYLENKQERLETFIETFKRTDKKYNKIKKIAEEYISGFLTNRQALLSAAIIAVSEALKMHPNKHEIICNTDSFMSTTTSEDQSEYEYYSNTIVLDTTNTLYDRILKWLGEKTMSAVESNQT
jgi:transposase